MTRPIITLTTDFGRADTYVAQMKGVIFALNEDAQIVDITHDIPPQDVLRGSMALGDIWRAFPPHVIHVAVVDPGVGTSRSVIAAKCDDRYFVLPNNGLLTHVLEITDAEIIVELQNANYWLENVSHTFHGRDMMAPVAAHLSRGVDIGKFGPRVRDIIKLPLPTPDFQSREIRGEVIAIDGFGNVITNLTENHVTTLPSDALLTECREQVICGLSDTYGQHPPGTWLVLLGSQGNLEIARVNDNAAKDLGAELSDPVVLSW